VRLAALKNTRCIIDTNLARSERSHGSAYKDLLSLMPCGLLYDAVNIQTRGGKNSYPKGLTRVLNVLSGFKDFKAVFSSEHLLNMNVLLNECPLFTTF
jgi:hypothetical protein